MTNLNIPAEITARDTRRRIMAIVGASSGNLVEWFDFYVYSFCALYFAPAFFPKGDTTTQLLNTAGVFAAGFLMRPIGGWFFGRLADKRGRRFAMMVSVFMMCGGSLVIAVLPSYASNRIPEPVPTSSSKRPASFMLLLLQVWGEWGGLAVAGRVGCGQRLPTVLSKRSASRPSGS